MGLGRYLKKAFSKNTPPIFLFPSSIASQIEELHCFRSVIGLLDFVLSPSSNQQESPPARDASRGAVLRPFSADRMTYDYSRIPAAWVGDSQPLAAHRSAGSSSSQGRPVFSLLRLEEGNGPASALPDPLAGSLWLAGRSKKKKRKVLEWGEGRVEMLLRCWLAGLGWAGLAGWRVRWATAVARWGRRRWGFVGWLGGVGLRCVALRGLALDWSALDCIGIGLD